ncbi:MAG: TetR/AcrR family transcriptional regulator [Candidatus Methylomirabilota bacterium]
MPPAKGQNRIPRWQRRPEVRPQQILEAAFRVFGTRGLHQATLDDVARAAGITKGTIYLYFPSKAALFSAMIGARVNDLVPSMEASDGRSSASVYRQLLLLARRLYQFFKSPAFLAMYRTMVGEAPQFPEAAALLYREGILPANRRLAEVIRRGITGGEFRPVDPLIAARALVGMIQVFVVSQGLLGGQRIYPMADAKIVRTITDIFFRGLLASSSRTRTERPRGVR